MPPKKRYNVLELWVPSSKMPNYFARAIENDSDEPGMTVFLNHQGTWTGSSYLGVYEGGRTDYASAEVAMQQMDGFARRHGFQPR